MAQKSQVKNARAHQGHTLLELMISISILTILTSISLIGIAAPMQLLETQAQKAEIKRILSQSRLTSALTGHPVELSFTPWVLWQDQHKALIFLQGGPWQWQGEVAKITLLQHGVFKVMNTRGQVLDIPQRLRLTYNQKQMLLIELDPQAQTIQVH